MSRRVFLRPSTFRAWRLSVAGSICQLPKHADDYDNHHHDNDHHYDEQQFNQLYIDLLNINQLNIQHHDNDNYHGGAMHRWVYLAMERGRPDMAALRHRQLLDGMLMSGADIAGDD